MTSEERPRRQSPVSRALRTSKLSVLGKVLAWPLLVLIQLYRRFLSPLKPPTCRFYPTCSSYAFDAVAIHGPVKGGLMGIWRILRCHPFHPGGTDPVPGSEIERRILENKAREAAAHVHSPACAHGGPDSSEEDDDEARPRNPSAASVGGKSSTNQ